MANPAVSQLVYLLDEAFEGVNWHSLVNNVGAVDERDWNLGPQGGDRSVRDIVEHVGAAKLMYDSHAFGNGQLTWDDAIAESQVALESVASAIEWLRDCHQRLRQSVAALSDDELTRPRKSHADTWHETLWLIKVTIEHDLYHSGEINLIRSLCGRETPWVRYFKQNAVETA